MPFKYIVAVSTGQAIAGVLLNIIAYILIASFGTENITDNQFTAQAFIFFIFAAVVVMLSLVFLSVFIL